MSAIIAKIVSIFTSIIMAILNLFAPSAPPADPYARFDLPEYELGEQMDYDVEQTVAFYNAAVRKTQYTYGASPSGKQMLKLIEEIDGDGAIGTVLKVAQPVIDRALERNNYSTSYIPGHGKLLANDVKDAAVYENAKGTQYVVIHIKDQVNGPDCDSYTSGPVSRGIGTLGSLDHALMELGAVISEGRETIEFEYTNAYIICEIDPVTGFVLGGTWHYDVDVNVGNARVKISAIMADIENLTGKIEYAVVLGE